LLRRDDIGLLDAGSGLCSTQFNVMQISRRNPRCLHAIAIAPIPAMRITSPN
jgi:hypothetical protein